jgi:hypothetical protein
MNNISGVLVANDDYVSASSISGAGISAHGSYLLADVANGVSVEQASASASVIVINSSAAGGTITNLSSFESVGVVDISGGNTVVTNLYGYKHDNWTNFAATNHWGLHISGADAENYFEKSLAIGTATAKVSNASVGLEIGGTTKALRLPVLTTAEKNALTALDGMLVFDTTLNRLSQYDGAAWREVFYGITATDVVVTPVGTIAATDVQAAVAELDGDIQGHISDTSDAHDASAISFVPAGTIAATDVQAAIQELDNETDGRLDALEAVTHAAVTLAAFGATPNASGLSLSTQALNMEPADATNPGGVSTAQQNFGGAKAFGDGIKVGGTGAPGTSIVFEVSSTSKFSVPMPVMTAAQRNAIATPAAGMMLYNSTAKHPEFYNGAVWEPIGHSYVSSTATISAAGNITPVDSRKQLLPVVGNAAAVTAADILVTSALNGDELVLIGTSDTNTVTIVSATNTVLNGSYTLALGYSIELVHLSGIWYEKNRSH